MLQKDCAKFLVGSALFLTLASPGLADDQVSVATVFTFAGDPVDGSSALVRTKDGVGMRISMRELGPGDAYTNWWVNFNNPQQCVVKCSCGDADFENPAVDIGVFWADGRVADAYGQAHFAANVAFGELPQGDDQVPFDPFFANPIEPGAEIHLIVRTHGAASNDAGEREDQLTKFQDAVGLDTHFSVHKSPTCKP